MSVVLSEHLPLLASAPDGIQKLRELVLRLAIEGRITGSDTSVWTRTTLGEVGEWGSGGTPLKAHTDYYGGGIPWLVIGDLNDGLVTAAETHITEKGLANSSAKLVPAGTLLIAMYGSIGKLGIAGIECATNQAIAHCKVDPTIADCRFLFYFVRAIRGQLLDSGQGLAQQNISQKLLKATSIRLPALAEQHRIVAKVDELMAICDRLEAEQADAASAHARLVETLLGTLTQSTGAADLDANWQRLAEHFDTLFTTETSIDALKQTVLQLAVMGKLVPKDPEDESACDLVARIMEERAFRDAGKKVSKQVVPAEVLDGPFALPSSWKWVPIGAILDVTSSKRIFESDYVPDGIPFYRSKEIGELSKKGATSANYYISEEKYREVQKARDFPKEGDLLLTSVGSIGNTWIVDDRRFYFKDGNITQILQNDLVSMPYLQRFIQGPVFMRQATDTVSGTAYNALTIIKIKQMLLPLPPLKEQYRIVTKIDELMGFCDQLRAYLTTARQREARLADALIESALEAA